MRSSSGATFATRCPAPRRLTSAPRASGLCARFAGVAALGGGILGAQLLGGCGSQPSDPTIDITYDPCVAQAETPLATEEQKRAAEEGLQLWRQAMGQVGLVNAADAARIRIQFESAAPAFFGVYDDERGLVFINRDQTPEHVVITIAHELGHAFGLQHVSYSERLSVMNPNNLVTKPTAEDVAAMRELWGSCDAPVTPQELLNH